LAPTAAKISRSSSYMTTPPCNETGLVFSGAHLQLKITVLNLNRGWIGLRESYIIYQSNPCWSNWVVLIVSIPTEPTFPALLLITLLPTTLKAQWSLPAHNPVLDTTPTRLFNVQAVAFPAVKAFEQSASDPLVGPERQVETGGPGVAGAARHKLPVTTAVPFLAAPIDASSCSCLQSLVEELGFFKTLEKGVCTSVRSFVDGPR